MYYEVYIDTLFLVNFFMDLLVLWTVGKLLKQSTTWMKLIGAATVGSIIVCVIVIYPMNHLFLNIIISYIGISLLIIYIAFAPKNIRQVIKLLIGLYLTTFLIGGSIVSIYYYTKVGYYFNLLFKGKFMGSIDIKTLFITSSIALIIIKLIIHYLHKVITVQRNMFNIQLQLNGKKTEIYGLLDTGNNLYDPISNTPVIVVEYDVIKDLLPDVIKEIIYSLINNKSDDFYAKLSELYMYKIRLIPFNSLGQENGMLVGMVSDYIEIKTQNDKKIEIPDVVIAIYNKKLSEDNSYQSLLHPEMIKNA